MMYDFLIVGAGPFGATFARLATDSGKTVKVIDRRDHIAGNTYTEERDGIHIHKYGAHIFHTNENKIWCFVNSFADFQQYHHKVKALSNGKMYTLPFNLTTMYELFGVKTPKEAEDVLADQRGSFPDGPKNLEEQALSLVGPTIYRALIQEYTRKQWGRDPRELPASIIKRIPVRFNWNDSYFNDAHVGIPTGGYTGLFREMLHGIDVDLGVDFLVSRKALSEQARTVLFTGPIDAFYGYTYGRLEYRGLNFRHERHETTDFQGIAVVNRCDASETITRTIEHRHFDRTCKSDVTWVTHESPHSPREHDEVYYPVNDEENNKRFALYRALADKESNVIFGGRLAEYRYYDMHQVIASAGALAKRLELRSFL